MAYGKKEFNFRTHPWESFIFFDIETVAGNKELVPNTQEYDAFKYKMRYSEEAKVKDFNTNFIQALYKEKAALYPEFGKIVTISVGKLNDEGRLQVFSFKGNDEKAILVEFNAWLNGKILDDPNTVLCGVNIKMFDLRYIFIRSIVHNVKPVYKHIEFTGLKPWEFNTCDLTDNWKQGSFYNAPLIAIAHTLELPSPKDDIDGSQVSSTYYNEMNGNKGLERISTYCEKDVVTTANMARRLRLEDILEVDFHKTKLRVSRTDKPVKGKGEDKSKKVVKEGVKSPEKAKEMPHILQLLHETDNFAAVEELLKEHILRKRVFPKDLKIIGDIIKGIYIKNDFVNGAQDTKAVRQEKEAEVDSFLKTLKK